MGQYDDLLKRSRPVSKKHPPMSVNNRAAQFLPFAALSGLDDALNEAARETLPRVARSEDDLNQLNRCFQRLERLNRPRVTFTVFLPDDFKDGGSYVPVTGTVKRMDFAAKCVVLADGQRIAFENIYAAESPDCKFE